MSRGAGAGMLSPERMALLRRQMAERGIAVPAAGDAIPRRSHADHAPLTGAQERLWFLDRLEPGGSAYAIPALLRLEGPLDVDALRAALGGIVQRHEVLRTTFEEHEGRPRQRIHPAAPFDLPLLDVSESPDAEEQALRLAGDEAGRPFDLARGPLFRALLVRLAAADHLLALSMHHVVSDGWSVGVLARELSHLYAAHAAGTAPTLPPLAVQYADYAAWRQDRDERSDGAALAWWTEHLAGAEPVALPTRGPRQARSSRPGAVHRFEVPAELAAAVRDFARAEGATPFAVLLAALKALVRRYTGAADVVVATPSAGRDRPELEGLIGFFVNTLPLRTRVDGAAGFRALVRGVFATVQGGYAHQDAPLERVLAARGADRDSLLRVMFSLQNATAQALGAGGAAGVGLAGLAMRQLPADSGAAKCDLNLLVHDTGGVMRAAFEYDASLFDADAVQRMAGHYLRLLGAALARPDAPVDGIEILSPEETQRLRDLAGGGEPVPAEPVHALFERQVDRTPESVALVQRGQRLTYRELDARANRLANHLRSVGVGRGARVGLCMERTPELVVAMIAVMKAGAAYVSIDPAYPAERQAFMVADAGCSVLVVDDHLLGGMPAGDATVVCPQRDAAAIAAAGDGRPDVEVTGADLAFILYTSGSTGRPKGSEVPHRSLPGFFRGADYARFGPGQVLLQHSSPSWDAFLLELWPALLTGGRTVLHPARTAHPHELLEQVREHGVSSLWLTSALFTLAVDTCPELLEAVPQVLAGGDAVSAAHARRALERRPGLRLVNGYGPSECTVFSTCHVVAHGFAGDSLPIGRPVGDRAVYLLDARLQLVPEGVAGEVCIGGPGVARGYRNRPSLTADRFVPDPFGEPGSRLYRTGDLARWLPDGTLEFLGRVDFQVKLRGFRVEPGEVEAALLRDPAVRQAVVVVREDRPGDRRLVGYVVPSADAVDAAALRARLRAALPEHMVPSAIVSVDALPLTPNGKVDRRALPAPDATAAPEAYQPPRTPTEELLAGIWEEVLGAPRVGADDDFFALGGHSLLVTRVVSRVRQAFGVELPVRAVFDHATVASLAGRIDAERRTGETPAPPVVPVDRAADLPLSFAQERLWFLDRMEPGGSAYNVPVALDVEGALDVAALAAALGDLVERHEALRTVFPAGDAGPRQHVLPPHPFDLPVVSLDPSDPADSCVPVDAVDSVDSADSIASPISVDSEQSADSARSIDAPRRSKDDAVEAEVRRLADEEARAPFDLARGPLFRGRLLRLAAHRHVLLLTLHHVVGDGWSMEVMFRELGELYRARCAGEQPALAPLPVQYGDFAAWQRQHLSGERLERQVRYWRGRLAGAPAVLELPTDRPRPAVQSFRGGTHAFALGAELSAAVRELARCEGVTTFMALLAAFQVLLSRWARQDDVVVGSPVAGRDRAETEGLIGFFVNTLALRADLAADPSFRALLAQVRETTLGAYAHQELPFEKLVEELHVERSLAYAPLFQAMFVMQSAPAAAPGLEGASVRPRTGAGGTAKFDLTLAMRDGDDGLRGGLEYAADLFDAATIRRMAGHFATLLASLVADPDRPVSTAGMVPADEEHEVVRGWNDLSRRPEYRRDATLHGLFEEQAARTPGAVALVHGEASLTYDALNRRANRLAHWLRSRGVGPEVPVGILMERTEDLVTAMYAVLKAGGAYVPLDPDYPAERLSFMLGDTRVPVLLTQRALVASLPPVEAEVLAVDEAWPGELAALPDENPRSGAGPESLAYLIYTSGSTGRPKGIALEHRAAASRVQWMREAFPDELREAVLGATSVCFDVSVAEIFGTLSWGGALILVRNALSLASLAAGQRITMSCMVPSAAAELVAMGAVPAGLGSINLAGEALKPATAAALLAAGVRQVVNVYGPSEDTTYSTAAWLTPGAERMTIGRPLANSRAYVLDRHLRPCPVGVPGELYLAGDGATRGYHRRPALTAERYLPDPFGGDAGARMYASGDLARWLPCGEIEYLGRLDHQVKIRGHRVEVGEVEQALAAHAGVAEAAVVAREDGATSRLVAYYVAAEPAPPEQALREHLRRRLPEYMSPSAWVRLDALPRTPSGKVDRRALPEPGAAGAEHAYAPPRTLVEELLAGIWEEVLGVERVGIHDDFFALGGHSLLVARMVARIRRALGAELPVRAVFEAPTVAGLAERLAAFRGSADAPPLVHEDGDSAPLSFAQQRMWLFEQLQPGTAVFNVPTALRVLGALSVPELEAALREIVRRHASLRTVLREVDGEPRQVVLAPSFTLRVAEVDGADAPSREAAALRIAAAEARRPFGVAAGPLFDAVLLRLGDDDHVLVIRAHHAVADGWSMSVLFRELDALYAAFAAGASSPLAEPALQYADFARWQRRWLAGDALESRLAWWRSALQGAPSHLELPADRPRPATPSHRGAALPLRIPADVAARVRNLARAEGATPFMALLAAFDALAYRYTGQADVVVGTPTANRDDAALEGLVGCFINVLPLRARVDGRAGFRALLRGVRDATLDAFQHGQPSFEQIVEAAGVAREPGRPPLVQVLFVLQNAGTRAALGGLDVRPVDVGTRTAKYDLSFYWSDEADGGFVGHLEYATDLYSPATVRGWMRHFERLLAAFVSDPDGALDEVAVMDDEERAALLSAGIADPSDYPSHASVHSLVEEQARRTPDRTAVSWDGGASTYGELNARANRLAHRLRSMGVAPEARVGLLLERGPDLPVAVLAVMKAGGAYVPLEASFPPARLAWMARDAGLSVVITESALLDRVPDTGAAVVVIDSEAQDLAARPSDDPMPLGGGESAVYVLYTSGSTGQPKGVVVPHRSVVNFLVSMRGLLGITANDAMLSLTRLGFDISVLELLLPLTAGARAAIADARTAADARLLAERISRGDLTKVQATPATWQMLVDVGWRPPAGLTLLSGGEALPGALAARLRAGGNALWNLYGPTETTIWSAALRVEDDVDAAASVALGEPIANTGLYVLDERLQPVLPGAAGELYIGGEGLSRGYRNRPGLTAERFVPNPHAARPGERLYRTGDLAARRADGTLAYLGRADEQVKVRGFRIEPGEIEAVLERHPAVARAVVVARGDAAGRTLAAFAVAAEGQGPVPAREVLALAARDLPAYMVPAYLETVDALPLNPNGKVDRRALAERPRPVETGPDAEVAAPRDAVEEIVAGAWCEVLGLERVGIHDDFFDLGGQSLLLTRVATRLRAALGVDVPVGTLFAHSTVSAQATLLRAAQDGGARDDAPPLERGAEGEPAPLSFAQQRLWMVQQMDGESRVYHLPFAGRLRGPLDVAALRTALEEVVRRHGALRTRFQEHGGEPVQVVAPPYRLELAVTDLSGHADAAARMREIADEEARGLFDLASGRLLRARLLCAAPDEHVLLLTIHHIAADGWSMGVLLAEVGALYRATLAGEPSPLPEPAVQYADYARWQRRWMTPERQERQLAYWRERLAAAPEQALRADLGQADHPGTEGATQRFSLSGELSEGVRRLSRGHQATLFMTLLAALKVLLRWQGEGDDVVVGTDVANRNARHETEGLIGFFVNQLVLRTSLAGDPTFAELLARVRATTLGAYENQDVPFERVVQALNPRRRQGGTPFFPVKMVLQNAPGAAAELPGLQLEMLGVERGAAQLDLVFTFEDGPAGLAGHVEYRTRRFSAELVGRRIDQLRRVLEAAVADPARRVSELSALLDGAEREQQRSARRSLEEMRRTRLSSSGSR